MHTTLLTDLARSTNLRAVDAELTEATRAAIQSTLLGEILANAEIGALAADRGTYIAANEHACRLLGLERSELIGTRVGELHPLSELPEQWAEIERGDRVGGDLEFDGLKVRYRAVRTTLAGLPITLGLFWRV
jgi:PAS domain-containing protein